MFRPVLALGAALLGAPVNAQSGFSVGLPLELPARPTSVQTALPYVMMVHKVLDTVTTRETPTTMRAKLLASETRSEWIVHRIKANVWVERTQSNYLGQIGVRVAIPCHVEYALDLGALRFGNVKFDPDQCRLELAIPPVQIRQPVPLLDEMTVEPMYKGLRGTLLDADKTRKIQEALVKEDYLVAAREAAVEVYNFAQDKARDQVRAFLQDLFRHAGAEIEVVVK